MTRTHYSNTANGVREQLEILLVEDNTADAGLVIRAMDQGALKHRLDSGLPKLDGRDVLLEIKSDDKLKDIPGIILTGSQSDDDIPKWSARCR